MVIELRHERDLEELLRQSQKAPIVIFKHSTRCSVSAAALDEIEAFAAASSHVPCGMLLVVEHRTLSEEVADRLRIPHASPQAIVVVNGVAAWQGSHSEVTAQALQHAIESESSEVPCPIA